MSTCTVTGTLVTPGNDRIGSAVVKFNIQNPVTGIISPKEVRTLSATDGTWSLDLVQGVTGLMKIEYPEDPKGSSSIHFFSLVIPSSASATFSEVWVD